MSDATLPQVRTGQGSTKLTKKQLRQQWLEQFSDPAFDAEIDTSNRLVKVAWHALAERTGRADAGELAEVVHLSDNADDRVES